MAAFSSDYIQINRTFHELAVDPGDDDNTALGRRTLNGQQLQWQDLLAHHRVVILSEAGSGKTQEIRHVARTLREEGKHAFFIRLEHVRSDIEDAFEEGDHEEFKAWVGSGEEGWLLLDSVDEARLRDPKDFELAIKKIGRLIAPIAQLAHVILTGRSTAWRAKSDYLLCHQHLPHKVTDNDFEQDDQDLNVIRKRRQRASSVLIVSLEDIQGKQMEAFLSGKGVEDIREFLTAVERADAADLTTRPQDLTELIEYWQANHKMGSRLELMKASVARRLLEAKPDQSALKPIAMEKLRKGAQLIAAACTLGQESAIRVPDGVDNRKGIPVKEVLPKWDDAACEILLGRPIFEQGIYGTVRFHHRSVREFLTAEWLHKLIVSDASRMQIENLFFRSQYGLEVIVPTMRPILPWLAILDGRILKRVARLAPEVLLEGGDPSQLPLATRSVILRQLCERMSGPANALSFPEYSAVQRFANEDLTSDIKALLAEYGEDGDIAGFLLRMVWQGELRGAAAEAKAFALSSREKYSRIAAFRALSAVCTPAEIQEVRTAVLSESENIDREWLAELVQDLPVDDCSLEWLVEAVKRAAKPVRYSSDRLTRSLPDYLSQVPLEQLSNLTARLNELLEVPPFTDKSYCRISKRYGWLLRAAGLMVDRLIKVRAPSTFDAKVLSVMRKIPRARIYGEGDTSTVDESLRERVPQWSELNHQLFWHDVAESRVERASKGEGLNEYWQVDGHAGYWSFDSRYFDTFCSDIAQRPLLDDKLIALTMAYTWHQQMENPAHSRNQLHSLSNGQPELEAKLQEYQRPAVDYSETLIKEQAENKRKAEAREQERENRERKWQEHLTAHLAELAQPPHPGKATNDQVYLLRVMQGASSDSLRWGDGNWAAITPMFGEEVARAFRKGVIGFWRGYRPQLRSEGAASNSVSIEVILGLAGLIIESSEDADSFNRLSPDDVALATRYALLELNGFPSWLTALYDLQPETVTDLVFGEIAYELEASTSEMPKNEVLHKVVWNTPWMFNSLAPLILERLKKPISDPASLSELLAILKESSLEDVALAALAAENALSAKDLDLAAKWYALWVGTDPAVAVPALSSRLAQTSETAKSDFAMRFLVALMGTFRGDKGSRQAFKTVHHLKALFLLMHEHIKAEDDIDRSGGGVFSPGLRDDAQHAREALFSNIRAIPGKEAYLALMEISLKHPSQQYRPWAESWAKGKATADADMSAWSPGQVVDFHKELERTPNNHRDLWYLAVDRLENLKRDLEDGDSSIAEVLKRVTLETEMRNYIGDWCQQRAGTRYMIPQEEELADAKRPDLRFHAGADIGPVPAELKLAEKWTGPKLFERLDAQLCGDYLRDRRSSRGIFLLIHQGEKAGSKWTLPDTGRTVGFSELIEALQSHWSVLASRYPHVEDVRVIGIDLTKRRGVHVAEPKSKQVRRKQPATDDGTRGRQPRKSKQ
ncbi:hypothetical protein GHO34_06660 [Pseudomonas sp. FSL R10-2245]|uniref:NACHT domain-containing protein n=1 Tax=Pseudomonas sp. FSL R10-2245 TaxID=2662200 RepID=UPI001294A26E|nr:hypothetical protein [Pseudomonas sp. FSL R10-2245]MQT99976.1 hypothetical protein [Pseudomonas sp. FSL R10-2245]